MENINGIKKTKSGWLIDVDAYKERERYYTGTRAGQIIRTTVDPTEKHNDYFPLVADLIIDMMIMDGEFVNNCSFYRRGWIVR